MRTVREWVTRIPLFDIVLAAALAVVTLVQTADTPSDRLALRMALSAVAPAALSFRRVHPALSVGLVALGMSVEALATESPDEIGVLLSVLVSAFTIAAEAGRREALLGLGLLAASIAITISVDPSDSASNIPITLALFLGLPAGLGFAFQQRGRALSRLTVSNEALRLANESAVEDERRRIARELHDVVAHAVTLIAVQAEAGQAALDTDPQSGRSTLDAIGATSRDALVELRALLALLREPADAHTGTPGMALVGPLLGGVRSAGARVDFTETGPVGTWDERVDQAAYRVIQESLTNALRHSQSPRISVDVSYEPAAIVIRIESVGAPHRSTYGGGSGLQGLRERVLGLGGSLERDGSTSDRFVVSATLPRSPS